MNLSLSKDTTEDLVNEFRLRSWNRTRSEAFAVRNPNYCHFPALMHTQRARQAPALHSRAESAVKHFFGNSPLVWISVSTPKNQRPQLVLAGDSHPGAHLPSGGEK
ncbi:hypothetical protein JEQ12_016549 [Ovis aries]|uniref:Uncharacterized protein n=1 Tax=Ovis aries TaxID=9940 RepID=A0A836AH58_SHEEP|nr:hypothetical protein JEQ12_016549 [Ovis aries]